MDYQGQEEALEASSNIFASVILSHLAAQRVKKHPDKERAQVKYELTKRLYRKGYSKDQVLKLYLFIDWLLHLSEADEIQYKEAVYRLEEEQHMAYISTIESMGIKQGLQQGLQQGESKILLRQLTRKFKDVPESYRQKLLSANDEQLLNWSDRILDAESLQDVFE